MEYVSRVVNLSLLLTATIQPYCYYFLNSLQYCNILTSHVLLLQMKHLNWWSEDSLSSEIYCWEKKKKNKMLSKTYSSCMGKDICSCLAYVLWFRKLKSWTVIKITVFRMGRKGLLRKMVFSDMAGGLVRNSMLMQIGRPDLQEDLGNKNQCQKSALF